MKCCRSFIKSSVTIPDITQMAGPPLHLSRGCTPLISVNARRLRGTRRYCAADCRLRLKLNLYKFLIQINATGGLRERLL